MALREYPNGDTGDTRPPAFRIRSADGSTVTRLAYQGSTKIDGKPEIAGLPCCYAEPGDGAETLIVHMRDPERKVGVDLHYTVLPKYDAICRHVEFTNDGDAPVTLENVASWSSDFKAGDYRMLHYSGAWSRECQEKVVEIDQQNVSIVSRIGMSGHQHNPFIALARGNTDERQGEVYGLSLVYSGSFLGQVEGGALGEVRATLGLNPENFRWTLNPGERFASPEVVGVYSREGLGGMSRRFHRLFQERLCRGPWRDQPRPVLVNSWEAFYMDLNQEKLKALAQAARDLGLELVVVDDGWFGRRSDDRTSLGDWTEDLRKLPRGLEGLGKDFAEVGVKLGVWFEPEMISRQSKLFEEHPEWALGVTELRHQLVLDLANVDVQDHLIETLSGIFARAPIAYVKWDYNRFLTEAASVALPPAQKAETMHRYILGLYRVLDVLTARFPHILFEGCASGGGRYDPGMLAYMPQTWTSDNTDAASRLEIQSGTGRIYPPITMGAHVSAVPNHQLKRVTSLDFRTAVAMAGNFGYELDLTKVSTEDLAMMRADVAAYQAIVRPLLLDSDEYPLQAPHDRLASRRAGREASNWPAFMRVRRDGSEALLWAFQKLAKASVFPPPLKLDGLDPDADYELRPVEPRPEVGSPLDVVPFQITSGSALMGAGIELTYEGDWAAKMIHLRRVAPAGDGAAAPSPPSRPT